MIFKHSLEKVISCYIQTFSRKSDLQWYSFQVFLLLVLQWFYYHSADELQSSETNCARLGNAPPADPVAIRTGKKSYFWVTDTAVDCMEIWFRRHRRSKAKSLWSGLCYVCWTTKTRGWHRFLWYLRVAGSKNLGQEGHSSLKRQFLQCR